MSDSSYMNDSPDMSCSSHMNDSFDKSDPSDVNETSDMNLTSDSDIDMNDSSDDELKLEILKAIDEYKENHSDTVICDNKAENITALEELDEAEEKLKTALKSLDVKRTPETRYHCPMPGCEFNTNKAGLTSKETAIHFRDQHGTKAKDMTPGMFRFIKKVG